MSWAAVAGAAVGVVGGAIQSNQSNKAARGAQDATNASAAEAARQFDITQQNNQPYQQAGYNALAQQQQLAQKYMGGPSNMDVQNEPGYQFGMQQGLGALENSQAARGGLFSTGASRATSRYATDYASTKFNDAWNRLNTSQNQDFNRQDSIRNGGQVANGQVQAAGQNYSNNLSGLLTNNANAQGANAIAQGNIWSNAVNQAGSAYNNRSQAGGGGGTVGWGSPGAGGSPDGYWADGGPVRREPKIGTREPLPGGSGGGMSRDAILAALNQAHAQAQAPQQPSGIGALPADYLRQPGKVRADQMQKAGAFANGGAVRRNYMRGGAVDGPGGPREDAIPARLSDGEHVFDTASVNALGGGNNERGQMMLNQLRAMLQSGAM